MEIIGLAAFFLPLLGTLIFFGISLGLYLSAKSRNRKMPGSVEPGEVTLRRILLIVSSVLAGLSVVIVLGIAALFTVSIAYM